MSEASPCNLCNYESNKKLWKETKTKHKLVRRADGGADVIIKGRVVISYACLPYSCCCSGTGMPYGQMLFGFKLED